MNSGSLGGNADIFEQMVWRAGPHPAGHKGQWVALCEPLLVVGCILGWALGY